MDSARKRMSCFCSFNLFVQIKGLTMLDLIGGLRQRPHCSEVVVMFW